MRGKGKKEREGKEKKGRNHKENTLT